MLLLNLASKKEITRVRPRFRGHPDFGRRYASEFGPVPSFCIVDPLDVVEHVRSSLGSDAVVPPVHPLALQAAEEAFRCRVVRSAPDRAHRAHQPVVAQESLVLVAGELGGFSRSLQHLNREELRWQGTKVDRQTEQDVLRCARPGGPR